MKRIILLTLIGILAASAGSAQAQLGNIKNKIREKTESEQRRTKESPRETKTSEATTGKSGDGYENGDFLFMGKNELDGSAVGAMTACVPGVTPSLSPPASKTFKVWITDISEVAALRTFNNGKCEVIAFLIQDNPQYKYKNLDSLAETAQGHSVYKFEGGKLALVKKFDAAQFYIVVVPDKAKAGLKLAELRLCGAPDTIKLFRRKTESVANCHDLKQSLYVFEKYKNYPSPLENNSVIFNAADFETLNKQGKFKGLAIYRLAGEELEPVK